MKYFLCSFIRWFGKLNQLAKTSFKTEWMEYLDKVDYYDIMARGVVFSFLGFSNRMFTYFGT
jgi:hypothetical protein